VALSPVVPLKKSSAGPRDYRILHRLAPDAGDERSEVIAGLRETPARIAPKYFYDELGCALYGAICQLPEYYPTRTEIAIFREHRAEIAAALGAVGQFVDLGAGDCCKAEGWLPFLNPGRYVAVDIAGPEIERALARLAPEFPEVEMLGVVTDFSRGLELDDVLDARPVTLFYPGSSIGNFTPEEALSLLGSMRRLFLARPGSNLLIGVDGKKEKVRLDAAYADALGVTAAFNRNVLQHLNRRFGWDFDLQGYRHLGFYNEARGRVEMHLESLRDQQVQIGGEARRFAKGERIHTENSYKYRPEEFAAILREAGYARPRHWTSPDGGYAVFLAA
jgi:dimethylhistidine N-methyltransferase